MKTKNTDILRTGMPIGPGEDNFLTPKGRVTFNNVFEATVNKMSPTAKPQYRITMVFDKNETDLSSFQQWLNSKIKQGYPGVLPNGFKIPFKDADEDGRGMQYDSYKNCFYFEAKASFKFKPEVRNELNKTINADSNEFYSGCYARIIVSTFCYGKEQKSPSKGILLNLLAVQKTGDGERLGAKIDIDNTFSPLMDEPNSSFAEDLSVSNPFVV